MSSGPSRVDAAVAPDRTSQVSAGLAAVQQRIRAAAAAAGRDPGELTLIAVTKTWPATDVGAGLCAVRN